MTSSQQKDYELVIYWMMKDLQKLREKVETYQSESLKEDMMHYLKSWENDLRICFGNNRKLDYLLELK